MEISTSSFDAGGTIPLTFAEPDAGGENVRPALSWSGAPEGTKSFAITIYDPDAPTGSGWWHWVTVDIPASITSLDEGAELPDGVREWVNDYGYVGYGGPCPPPGPAHRYQHTVHALPFDKVPVSDDATSAQLRATVITNALASATITGLFAVSG